MEVAFHNSKGSGAYKWWLLAFLFVTFFLEQGTRQIYNAALPQIRLDFLKYGVSDAQLGMVGTVFGAVFGFSLVGSGLAADFLGRKRVLVVGTLLFSLGVCGSGFASGLACLIACYGVMNALGQCCVAPPCYSLISQHHGADTRSTAMAIFQSAVYVGVILSSVFAGRLAEMGEGGWRWAFWIMGGLGVIWAIVMQLFMRNTPQPSAEGEKPSMKEAFLALLRKPTAILIAVAFGTFIYAQLGIRLWTPLYLVREFPDVGIAKAAFHSVIWLNLGSTAGAFVTARLIDRFGTNRPSIRLEVSALGFLLCILPVVWVAKSHDFVGCCLALGALGVMMGVYDASHYPAMFDCIAPRYRSATTGLTGCWAYVFGSAAPAVLGWMSERFSMRTGFLSLSVFYFAGALVLLPAILHFFRKDYIKQEDGR